MSTVEEKLGKRIARQRKAVGLTQAQLAETVGVQPETISRDLDQEIERRRLAARLDAADGLGLHADRLGQLRLREPDCLALPRDPLPELLFDCAHPATALRWLAILFPSC